MLCLVGALPVMARKAAEMTAATAVGSGGVCGKLCNTPPIFLVTCGCFEDCAGERFVHGRPDRTGPDLTVFAVEPTDVYALLLLLLLLLSPRWLHAGILPQAQAFRAGCAEVFPVSTACVRHERCVVLHRTTYVYFSLLYI